MLTIRDPRKPPDGGGQFIYVDPDSGTTFRHHTPEHLLVMARKHRQSNGYAMCSTWNQEFVDNVCAHSPGDTCVDDQPPTLAEKIVSVGKALHDAAISGFKCRSAEEIQAIVDEHCSTCQYFGGIKGIFHVACNKCGCSKLKLHLASSHCPVNKW